MDSNLKEIMEQIALLRTGTKDTTILPLSAPDETIQFWRAMGYNIVFLVE